MGCTEALRRIKILLPVGQGQRVEKELCRPENSLYREMVKLRGYFMDLAPFASLDPGAVASKVEQLLVEALPKPQNRAYGVTDGVPLELPRSQAFGPKGLHCFSLLSKCRSLHIHMSGCECTAGSLDSLDSMKSVFRLFDTQQRSDIGLSGHYLTASFEISNYIMRVHRDTAFAES